MNRKRRTTCRTTAASDRVGHSRGNVRQVMAHTDIYFSKLQSSITLRYFSCISWPLISKRDWEESDAERDARFRAAPPAPPVPVRSGSRLRSLVRRLFGASPSRFGLRFARVDGRRRPPRHAAVTRGDERWEPCGCREPALKPSAASDSDSRARSPGSPSTFQLS